MILTASKPSTNQVLSNIIQKVVKEIREGFNGSDPFQERATMFLNIIIIVEDYPAGSPCAAMMGFAAIMGLAADTLCFSCIIERQKGTQNRKMVCSFNIHSRRL